MMKKRLPIALTFILGCLALSFSLLLSVHQVYGDTDIRKMTPIFNGNDGIEPKLKLIECSAYDEIFNPSSYPNYNFRSQKVVYATEAWGAKRKKDSLPSYISRTIFIKFYYFQYPEDAVIYPYLPDERANVLGVMKVPPWPDSANLGDKTMWLGNDTVLFVKGKVLVRVDVVSGVLTKDMKYLEKIARIVADRL